MEQQQFEYIKIENLELDVYNPRLPKSKQGKDENVIIEYLLLEAATVELMESIGENGFFAGEMLLVIPNEQKKDKFIVVEGNRRLTAVLLLNNPQRATVKKTATKEASKNARLEPPTELPCLVFKSRNDIQQFLGFVHITGKKSWRLLEKARYLNDLRYSEKYKNFSLSEACKEIARIIGSKWPYVKKMLISYKLYEIIEDEKFYQIEGLSDSTFYLNYLTDGLQKENIKAFLNIDFYSENPLDGLNRNHLKELCSWWFEKSGGVTRVIGDSEGMKMLNMVLGNEVALNTFRKSGSLDAAYQLTKDIDYLFENKVKESLQAIMLADGLVYKVQSFYDDLYSDLKNLRQIAFKIHDFKTRKELNSDDF